MKQQVSGFIPLKTLFSNTRGFTDFFAQVVQLGASNRSVPCYLNSVNLGGVYRKGSFNTNTARDLTHRESLSIRRSVPPDHITFIYLNALFVTFDDTIVYPDSVSNTKVREIPFDLLLFQRSNDIHFQTFSISNKLGVSLRIHIEKHESAV
jgi:hypothetical protein